MPDGKKETIGRIQLDLTHYPGEDYYSDGSVEDELLEIARNYAQVEYQSVIEERLSWPILYHLSPQREHIVDWLPITGQMKVLEVGAGCGAITGALARKAGEVTCVDLSLKRSRINAYRHMDADNVTIHVANFRDVEPELPCDYDYICLIGAFEYAQAYMGTDTPYEDFLRIIRKHLKPQGRIAIAIENRFGLKYWAGCMEDHLGKYFAGLENYPDGGVVRTFTADGLRGIARRCGYEQSQIQMYYPYPDYKFMMTLYSDDRLPRRGELSDNLRNFDRDRLQLFDEKRAFDSVIDEGLFPLFSNSYMMLLGPALEEQYVKYSGDRAPAFCIKTVQKQTNGVKTIEKHPLSKEAWLHIRDTAAVYTALEERYKGSGLAVNQCRLVEEASAIPHTAIAENTMARADAAEGAGTAAADAQAAAPYLQLDYVEGRTLEELLDGCLERADTEGFHRLFDEYYRRISAGETSRIADYDLIFSNIIVPEDINNTWNVIDCEWSFEREIPAAQIAFRAVYCYLLENEKRNKLNLDLILDKLNIDHEEAENYRSLERKFQSYVTGRHMSLGQLREAIGHKVYTLEDFCRAQAGDKDKDRIQVYEDTGSGFREEQSFFPDMGDPEQYTVTPEGTVMLRIAVPGGRSALRVDPCSDCCVVHIERAAWNGVPLPLRGRQITANGVRLGEGTYVFDTQDPNITLALSGLAQEDNNCLEMVMEITRLPENTAKHMRKRGLL